VAAALGICLNVETTAPPFDLAGRFAGSLLQHWHRLPAGQGHKDRLCNAALRTPGPGPTIDTGRSKGKRTQCASARRRVKMVPRDGIEPPTSGFSISIGIF
jgi:hypothetical protein